MRPVPHNRPFIAAEDRAAVEAVLSSGRVAQGVQVESLEANFVRHYDGGRACAVSSGTAALFLALQAMKIGTDAKVVSAAASSFDSDVKKGAGSNTGAGTASGSAAGNVGTTATANANSSQFVSSFAQAY